MRLYDISFNGRNFLYGNYRYEQLDDAIAYAQRAIPSDRAMTSRDAVTVETVEFPSPDQKLIMRTLSISYRLGYYYWGPYRYERLRDAVAYARASGS